MALQDRWVQAEVNDLLERRLSPNPLVSIHKYPNAGHAFARYGGKTYSKPEADRALALTSSSITLLPARNDTGCSSATRMAQRHFVPIEQLPSATRVANTL